MALAGLSLFTSVIILNFHHNPGHSPPPPFVQTLLRSALARFLCVSGVLPEGNGDKRATVATPGGKKISPEVRKHAFTRKPEVSVEQALAQAETIEDLERIAHAHAPVDDGRFLQVLLKIRG